MKARAQRTFGLRLGKLNSKFVRAFRSYQEGVVKNVARWEDEAHRWAQDALRRHRVAIPQRMVTDGEKLVRWIERNPEKYITEGSERLLTRRRPVG
jgi:hypothetical protein